MKLKEILKLIFVNPFEKVAGWQALGLGLIFVVAMTFIAFINKHYFTGAFDLKITRCTYALSEAFVMMAIGLASIILMFLLAGICFSKNFRVIDVFGTTILAKFPHFFLALNSFIPMPFFLKDPKIIMEDPNIIFTSFTFMMNMILSLLIMVWLITLLYNAFRVSLNIRKNLRVGIFISAMLLAEILSKVLMHYIL
jgi:hypothetical protein